MAKFWPTEWLWRPSCVLCGAAGTRETGPGSPGIDLCAGCRETLPANRYGCRRCASPLAGIACMTPLCGGCRAHPPEFERCLAPFRYAAPLDSLLRGFKYGGKIVFGRVLGQLLAGHVAATALPVRPEVIVPVPLHSARLRERGYNQAVEIARPMSRRLGIPVQPRLCRRVRPTLEQAHLGARDRRENVRGAFEVASPVHQHVAIIDDVVTTGSTVSELARILKRAGAETVQVWAVARAAVDG